MAEPVVYECIICGTRANERPPRRCPRCNTPAARFKLVVKGVDAVKKTTNGAHEAKPAEGASAPANASAGAGPNGTTSHA